MVQRETKKALTPAALKASIERQVAKKLGEGVVGSLARSETAIECWYSTGVPPLDVILTGKVGKGMPGGRLVELYGYESVGKTTLGVCMLAAAQKTNALACLIDTESRFTMERAKHLGLDTSKLVFLQEEYLEPILDAISVIVTNAGKQRVLVFWDTVAGTPSSRERGGNTADSSFGAHARALSKGLRNLSKPLAKSNVLLLACNQLKDGAIGQMFATERDKDATLGGRAIKFHADMRISLKFNRKLRSEANGKGKDIGFETTAKTVKNTNLIAGGAARLVFQFSEGGRYDAAASCLRTLQVWGICKQKGGRLEIGKRLVSQDQFPFLYNEDQKFRTSVHELLETSFASAFLPGEEEE